MMKIPFFRTALDESEINEVEDTLRSGWLTTGPKTKKFEADFAAAVGAKHAIALNSATAGLHLALEAVGLEPGELVLVPALTFAAGAEVVRYDRATPVFVDCDESLCMSPAALEATLTAIEQGKPIYGYNPPYTKIRAIMPMHYGGYTCAMDEIMAIAAKRSIPVIEDAAHCVFSKYKQADGQWKIAGRFGVSGVYSFYANKCITTGEGGMVVTDDDDTANRIRLMSLHGMNKDAWKRFTDQGSWYYELTAAGFKYNLTDMASALGIHQLEKVEIFRQKREAVAMKFNSFFANLPQVQLPPNNPDKCVHSWHLYCLRLNLERLTIDRAQFIEELKALGVSCSVHWMPLPMNPYYVQHYGFKGGEFPAAEAVWPRLVSLPIFPAMTNEEIDYVGSVVEQVATKFAK